MFKKEEIRGLTSLIFLLLFGIIIAFFVSQIQVLRKNAAESSPQAVFNPLPTKPLPRIWNFFSQGGEENKLMLSPVSNEIKKLQPKIIRIDHIYDFDDVIKDNSYDFSGLDKRVQEIINLGAIPLLSLSYFPSEISSNLIEFPSSLGKWGELVYETVKRYSGKNNLNLGGVYYEVWNEPDLFGKFTPQQYFSLYQVSVNEALKCAKCNYFRIGGPAITTLKKDWLSSFLNLVSQSQTRLDFISWHSYQLNPEKTLSEVGMVNTLGYSSPNKELLITEAGSLPEVSSLHDSYFDASHVISAVSLLKNSIDKYFSFELKDGLDPEGKKYWGRWGLLTHESKGITAKPRYYSFIYLNKLLTYEITPVAVSPGLSVIGSSDGKETYSLIVSRSAKSGNPDGLTISIPRMLPGIYLSNAYTLAQGLNPLAPLINETNFNGGEYKITLPTFQNAVHLVEITRISPALVKSSGKGSLPNDFSAKITSFVPPLVFSVNNISPVNGDFSFWFKPNWGIGESAIHTLLETKDGQGSGLLGQIINSPEKTTFVFSLDYQGQKITEISIPAEFIKDGNWHLFKLSFDNTKMNLTASIDSQINYASYSLPNEARTGGNLFIGSDSGNKNSAEGSIDDLEIFFNGSSFYSKNFNQD